jgi:hypothetical protein
VPDITQEGHVDKLDYGWWEPTRGNIMLPKTIGQKNNYVLTHEELAAYEFILMEMKERIESEHARVVATLIALRKGKIDHWTKVMPTCFTVAHILQFMLKIAKSKLAIMELLKWAASQRVKEKQNAPNRQ